MSSKTNNTDKDPDHIYQCRECGSHWPQSSVAVRPFTRLVYCRTCQSGRLRLCSEADAVEGGQDQENKRTEI